MTISFLPRGHRSAGPSAVWLMDWMEIKNWSIELNLRSSESIPGVPRPHFPKLSLHYIFHTFFVIFDSFSSLFLMLIPFHSMNIHSSTSHSFPFFSPPFLQDIRMDSKMMKKIFN